MRRAGPAELYLANCGGEDKTSGEPWRVADGGVGLLARGPLAEARSHHDAQALRHEALRLGRVPQREQVGQLRLRLGEGDGLLKQLQSLLEEAPAGVPKRRTGVSTRATKPPRYVPFRACSHVYGATSRRWK